MSQAGFDPPLAESAQSTEWESDALAKQATTAGNLIDSDKLYGTLLEVFRDINLG